jgi:hypothetical protein
VLAALLAALVLAEMLHACAAGAVEDDTELAKKTQNPVADLISVPYQSNFSFNTGSKDATVYILNVQPVIPIHLTRDWNLITRTIMPIMLFPGPNSISGSAWGLGEADSGDKWTVPVGGGVRKLGKLPINTSLQATTMRSGPGTPRTGNSASRSSSCSRPSSNV